MEIKHGDRVEIQSQGITARGVVISAQNHRRPEANTLDCWYIEMRDDDGTVRFWKQNLDGGSVRKLTP